VQKYPKGSMDYAESLEDIRRQMDKTDFDPCWWYMCNRFRPFAWLLAYVWWWITTVICSAYLLLMDH